MANASSSPILQLISCLIDDQRVKGKSDAELLQRLCAGHDEASFCALVRRHGPMVLDVCRAVLANEADAEDAFQATFLVLARKVASLRTVASLGAWLHGVAYRTALKARTAAAKRRLHEARVPRREALPPVDMAWREMPLILHEELNSLADRFRAPLVVCYLQAKTQDEAAALLGLPKGTLKGRLERARALLRARLLRRGLGPAAVLLASAWPAANAPACLPPTLLLSTVKAASVTTAAQALANGLVSANVAALTKEVLPMFKLKLSIGAAVCLTLGAVGVGVTGFVLGTGKQDASIPEASTVGLFTKADDATEAVVPDKESWGTLKGKVVFAGDRLPKRPALTVDRDKAHCLSRGPIPDESLVVNPKDKGVKWVVVWLAKEVNGKADHAAALPIHESLKEINAEPIVMDQPFGKFEPHVVALRAGQTFVGKNSAPITGNMKLTGRNRQDVNHLLNARSKMELADWKPYHLPTTVNSQIHRWMKGYIYVFSHPYFAVTDENGSVELKNAPVGKYRLVVWQEEVGWVLGGRDGRQVTIKGGQTTDLGEIQLHSDREQLQGDWTVVSATQGGRQLDMEALKGAKVRFQNKRFELRVNVDRLRLEGTFQIDQSLQPKAINIISTEQGMQLGIYQLKNDELRLCINPKSAMTRQRPTQFTSEAGTANDVLVVAQRPAKRD